MRGRKRTPTHLRVIAGNPGNRPLNQDEPQPEGDLYAPPSDMTAKQQAIWRHAIEHAPKGLLRRLDSQMLAVWVIAADMHHEAMLAVQKFGMVVKSPTAGVPIQSPYMAIVNRQAEIMLRAASELGFSPTSRSRITLAGGGSKEANRFSANAAKSRA